MRFILGAKRADPEALFEWVEATQRLEHSAVKPVEHHDERGIRHRLRYLDGVPLDETHIEREVNFLESWERRPDGRELHFARATDLPIGDTHAMESMRAARARWRIENETFDILNNQGGHTALAGVRECHGEACPRMVLSGELQGTGSRRKTSCDAARGAPVSRSRDLRLPRVRPAIRSDRPR